MLSGNRNFEGRISPDVQANYLASPPLVVAHALAGTVAKDLETEPLGHDKKGKPVFLADIWPSDEEIAAYIDKFVTRKVFKERYADVFDGDVNWRKVKAPEGETYKWDIGSTYVQNPPYFEGLKIEPEPVKEIENARILAIFGDKITTDHISPAGSIKAASPAGTYLLERQVSAENFNQYGTRRGNHEIMMRGTFANIRIKNFLRQKADGSVPEGGYTKHWPDGEELSIFDAAMKYQAEGVPLVVFAGAEYGNGSSRDWAAKGTRLLGVRAVIAESFERIHRSNLVGMGVLPLTFEPGTSLEEPWPQGRRGGHHPRPRRLPAAAPENVGRDQIRQRRDQDRAAALPHRDAGRTRLFQKRRHPRLRPAPARGGVRGGRRAGCWTRCCIKKMHARI